MSRRSKFIIWRLCGPGFAFLALSLGCAEPWQLMGVMCGHNAWLSLVALSLLGWVAYMVAMLVLQARRQLQE